MTKPKQPTIKEQLEALKATKTPPTPVEVKSGKKFDPLIPEQVSKQTAITPEVIPVDGKVKKRGGYREGAGGKPKEETLIRRGIKALLDEQVMKEVDVTVTDPKTGKSFVVKKPQVVLIMEMLFIEGYKNKNIGAAKEWLDRALGKSAQPLFTDGDGDIPLKFGIDIQVLLDKAWPVKNQAEQNTDGNA